jgi:hypothetical protein
MPGGAFLTRRIPMVTTPAPPPDVIDLKPGVRFRSGSSPALKQVLADDRVLMVLEMDGEDVTYVVDDPTMGHIRRGKLDKATLLVGARSIPVERSPFNVR